MSDAEKVPIKVRIYKIRNKLKDKAAGLGTAEVELDPAMLAEAEAMFESMAEDYPDWAGGLIQKMADLHRRCVDTPEERRPLFEQITAIAHDLKGQGGTFGYPLVSSFASSLNRFSSRRSDFRDSHVEIIKAHVDVLRAVIRDRISGTGGEIGEALNKGLEMIIARHER
jgi:chemotaxis protein histidine kinase CheA